MLIILKILVLMIYAIGYKSLTNKELFYSIQFLFYYISITKKYILWAIPLLILIIINIIVNLIIGLALVYTININYLPWYVDLLGFLMTIHIYVSFMDFYISKINIPEDIKEIIENQLQ